MKGGGRKCGHVFVVFLISIFKAAGLLLTFALRLSLFALLFSDSAKAQTSFPAPPPDRTLIYLAGEANDLEAMPIESGTTPLKTERVAGSDKTSYIELAGSESRKVIDNTAPRFYLFVSDEPNVHPPFIVRLTQKRGVRRVTAMAQRGYAGFAIYSEAIVKPRYRVRSHIDRTLYMEISPRESLTPGEYAIIGADLRRIATFRVVSRDKVKNLFLFKD